jgi:hypothetical protein
MTVDLKGGPLAEISYLEDKPTRELSCLHRLSPSQQIGSLIQTRGERARSRSFER